ncbi:MAG: GNAT family N-acetyltransferase, partial [Alistipes sp.]|nr:GNAT family N-acetyltransferase [Alistipes sp.]
MIETNRLILRPWREDDILPFSEINKDEEVMEYLPKCLSLEETEQLYNRIVAEHNAYGYGLYAVEIKDSGSFIGYVGFHRFDFDAEFSPGIEIGWRLAREHWDKGYATEAAEACLAYARKYNLFNAVYSFSTIGN